MCFKDLQDIGEPTTFLQQRGLSPHALSSIHPNDFQLQPRNIIDGTLETLGSKVLAIQARGTEFEPLN